MLCLITGWPIAEGYSGADVTSVCRDASMAVVRKKTIGLSPKDIQLLKDDLMNEPVTAEDFDNALKKVSSSVSKQDLDKYQDWMDEYGSI